MVRLVSCMYFFLLWLCLLVGGVGNVAAFSIHPTTALAGSLRSAAQSITRRAFLSSTRHFAKRENIDFEAAFADECDDLYRLALLKKQKQEANPEHRFISKQFQSWFDNVIKTFEINLATTLQPIVLPEEYVQIDGVLNKVEPVTFRCQAFQSTQLSYLRYASLVGEGYYAFNLMVLPKIEYDLPILSINVVVLPGDTIASVDFQPLEPSPSYLNQDLYQRSKVKLAKWKLALPPGGELLDEMAPYCSPISLRSNFPSNKSNALLFLIGSAIKEYTDTYTQVLSSKKNTTLEDAALISKRRKQLEDYLETCIAHDLAKNLLVSGFGKGWTDSAFRDAIFPSFR